MPPVNVSRYFADNPDGRLTDLLKSGMGIQVFENGVSSPYLINSVRERSLDVTKLVGGRAIGASIRLALERDAEGRVIALRDKSKRLRAGF